MAVYQDVMLARHLSVGENFFLGKLPRSRLGLVDWKKISEVTRETLEELDLSIAYGMGYKGCTTAVTLLDGGTVPKYLDTGAVAVTKENMNDKKIQDLLDPTRLKR